MVWDLCQDPAGILLSSFRRNPVHNHILVCFEFLRFNLICGQEEFGITVTRIARSVLGCFTLDVVWGGHSPTRYNVRVGEGDAIPLEQISIRWHVPNDDIVVRMLSGLGWILPNLEIEPRGIERTERQTLGIFTGVTIGAILVGD